MQKSISHIEKICGAAASPSFRIAEFDFRHMRMQARQPSGMVRSYFHRTPPIPVTLPSRPFAYLCLALSMTLVGSYVALSKPLAAVLPVFLLAWMRFGIGTVAMLHWLRKPADEPPLTVQTKRLLFLESFLGNFLFTVCMIYGVSLTNAVSAGVTLAAIPAAVAVMGWIFLRERVAPRTWAAVACAVVGIALFSLSKPEHSAHAAQALDAKNTQTRCCCPSARRWWECSCWGSPSRACSCWRLPSPA